MYRYSKSMVALPDFLIFGLLGPPKFGKSLTWQTLPIFIVPKFGVTDLLIFVFTLPGFQEISSKKSADSKKSGSGTTALLFKITTQKHASLQKTVQDVLQ